MTASVSDAGGSSACGLPPPARTENNKIMNRMKNMCNILILGFMAAALVALPGCEDSKKDENGLAAKIAGHWNTTGSYEKIDGEWVNIMGANDVCWYKFRPDGTVTAYQRVGDHERLAEMQWTIDEKTAEFRLIQDDGQSFLTQLVFENDDEFALLYTRNYDVSTGQPRIGEFKDVLRRVKE